MAEVVMIPKPGKPPHEATSYRPISLLPIISKLFEKLLLKRLKLIVDEKNLIPGSSIWVPATAFHDRSGTPNY